MEGFVPGNVDPALVLAHELSHAAQFVGGVTMETAAVRVPYEGLDGETRWNKRAEVEAWQREVKIARETGLCPRAFYD